MAKLLLTVKAMPLTPIGVLLAVFQPATSLKNATTLTTVRGLGLA